MTPTTRRRMRGDWFWAPLLYLGTVPLGLTAWLFEAIAGLCGALEHIFSSLQIMWQNSVRQWSGRDWRGWTPEMIAEEDARREALLCQMRAERLNARFERVKP